MAKIAISLPDEVLEAVEKERLGRSKVLSRSEFIKRAVEQYLRTESERTMEVNGGAVHSRLLGAPGDRG